MRILHLTLHKKAFEVMITGEKQIEIRKPTPWLLSRLKKDYTHVKFVNGYGSDKPYFICKFSSWEIQPSSSKYIRSYSNGLEVPICPRDILIYLGPITEKGNL